jgi:N,N dimethylarginine dimethylhydrolase, eukaryotic
LRFESSLSHDCWASVPSISLQTLGAHVTCKDLPTLFRQAERRQDIIDVLRTKGYTRVLDLSAEEQSGRYLEGTGVLVLDRINGVAYVSLSDRANKVHSMLLMMPLNLHNQSAPVPCTTLLMNVFCRL